MATCLGKTCSFGLLCVSHRRRKVLNIGGGAGQNIGRGQTFRWL